MKVVAVGAIEILAEANVVKKSRGSQIWGQIDHSSRFWFLLFLNFSRRHNSFFLRFFLGVRKQKWNSHVSIVWSVAWEGDNNTFDSQAHWAVEEKNHPAPGAIGVYWYNHFSLTP